MKKLTVLCFLVCLGLPAAASADLLLQDEFDFAGLLTANGWTAHSGSGTNDIAAAPPGLSYPGYPATLGNAAPMTTSGEDVNRLFTKQTAGSVYYAFLVNVSAARPAGDYFIHLGTNPWTSSYYARVYCRSYQTGVNFGISYSNSAEVYAPDTYALGATHLVVVKYTFVPGASNDTASLWVDPPIGDTEPAATASQTSNGTDVSGIGDIALRQGTAGDASTQVVDGIRVGLSWAEVVYTYTIAASAGANGSITPNGALTVAGGGSQAYSVAAAPCYHIADVLVDGSSVGAVAGYTFSNVTANHNISASFALNTYTLTATAGGGGSITPAGANGVGCGSSLGFAITPDACYHVVDVLVDGASVGPVSSYIFSDVEADHTIAASFAINTHTITASAGPNGSISPGGTLPADCGSELVFAILPDPCYHVADVLVDGASVGAVSGYTFTGIAADHTISAGFAIDSYTITASAGTGGSIDPPGAVPVDCGAGRTFTIAAGHCHAIADVLVDGVSQGPITSYTFSDVAAPHTIAASFSGLSYTITASAGDHGSITPADASVVDCEGNLVFSMAAEACYHIVDVLVDGTSVGPVSGYTFSDVEQDHAIAVSFARNGYTIAASAGSHGSITPAGTIAVDCGAEQVFAVTPETCYHLTDVVVDGVSQGPITSYTFSSVGADHTIAAGFAMNTYSLATSIIGGGSLAIAPVKPVYDCGDSVSITAVPGTGWSFDHWAGDAAGSVNPLTVVMTGNQSLTAVFVDIAPPVIRLINPDNGDVLVSESTHNIEWVALDNVGVTSIDLAYSIDGGVTFPYTIVNGLVVNPGAYTWTIPHNESKTARVRAMAHDAAGNTSSDMGDGDFEIRDPLSTVADELLGTGRVSGVYPNPAAGGAVHVLYRVSQPGPAEVSIFDISGHLVRHFAIRSLPRGTYDQQWDGRDAGGRPAGAGIYLIRVTSGAATKSTLRLTILR